MNILILIVASIVYFFILVPLRGFLFLMGMDPMRLKFRSQKCSSYFRPYRSKTARKRQSGRSAWAAGKAVDDAAAPDTLYPLW